MRQSRSIGKTPAIGFVSSGVHWLVIPALPEAPIADPRSARLPQDPARCAGRDRLQLALVRRGQPGGAAGSQIRAAG